MQKDQIVLVAHQNTQTIDYVGVFDSAQEADAFRQGLRVRDGRAPNDTITFTRLDDARDGWEGFWTDCSLAADIDDPEARELVEETLELE